ncbi:MAG: Hsp20/alpha crystallin family protein [Agathobacter sp.]|nr:Hsp20/alpha crystallin family protein [Agathobacter sp.]
MLMPSIFGENLFDDIFDGDFFRPAAGSNRYSNANTAVMKTDVRENQDSFDIDIDLPGYKKDDVKAELKDGYMTITAEKNDSNEEKDNKGNYIRRERFYGTCSRSFYVGDDVTEEDIKAKFEDGILKINVPKREKKEEIPQKKYICIEG